MRDKLKFVAVLLAFVIAVTGIYTQPAYALEFVPDFEGNLVADDADGFYYMIPAGKTGPDACVLVVYGGSKMDIELPLQCGDYRVTTVGKDFASMVEMLYGAGTSLKTVRIPYGYMKIESGDGGLSGAFQNQKGLYRVEIPESVEVIGENAFTGCDLSKLTIVTPKGSYAEGYAKAHGINYTSSRKVAIDPKGKTMRVGGKKTVAVYNNGSKVSWKSSKPSVASVSAKGVITARKAGKTKITATIKGKKYSFTLTVKKKK